MDIIQDLRIRSIEPLSSPREMEEKCPVSAEEADRIASFRRTVNAIIKGEDDRLLAVIGPCSIHDTVAALDYARRLRKLADSVSDVFFIVMRTYFEKPRTALGWKGLIIDPDMDDSGNIEKGLMIARRLLVDITDIGLPVGCEVLDPIVPQYTDELMSWSSIGARTTESQTHRSLASGLSVAVGFKNSTSGDLTPAVNAAKAAANPASFIGVGRDGKLAIFHSAGNDATHLILRGGDQGPNYYEDDVEEATKMMKAAGLKPSILVDCWGEKGIRGFMLESNIEEGSQKIPQNPADLRYGVSVTDGCIGWEETERIIKNAAVLVREAREQGGKVDIL